MTESCKGPVLQLASTLACVAQDDACIMNTWKSLILAVYNVPSITDAHLFSFASYLLNKHFWECICTHISKIVKAKNKDKDRKTEITKKRKRASGTRVSIQGAIFALKEA